MERAGGGSGLGWGLLRGVTSQPGVAVWGGCIMQRVELLGKGGLVCPGFNDVLQHTLLGGPSIFRGSGGEEMISGLS